ncbi:MAG: hypothetical protein HQ518_17560 [Rhodopirellula sp.]|nr:hypothetical protein [Rhodopirellula sp.]
MSLKMHRFVNPAIFAVLTLVAVLSIATAPSAQAAKKNEAKKSASQGLKLTPAEARFLRGLEKKLATKLNSKNNPADEKTWYALLLLDQAVVQKETASKSGSSVSLQQSMWLATKPDGVVVQGRSEAALALARFLVGDNNAAKGLGRFATGDAKTRVHVNANKQWRFYFFKTEQEAKALLAKALPPSKTARK